MSAEAIIAISEIVQSLLLPALALCLAWQAVIMRQLTRQILAAHLQIGQLIEVCKELDSRTGGAPRKEPGRPH